MITHILAVILAAALAAGTGAPAPQGQEKQGTTAPAIPELRAETFAQALAQGGAGLLEFGGQKCIPCREMQPILRELKRRHPSLLVANIYMENSRGLLDTWKIQLIPTQVLIGPDGKELTRHVGVWKLDKILAAFKKHGVKL